MPAIQIQIINIDKETRMTKANKPYEVIEVTYKNLTFQGKVESKKLMPFGDTAPAAKTLATATNGEVYDIQWQKDPTGQYNNWTSAAPAGAASPAGSPTPQAPRPAQAGQAPVRAWQGESPEERAAKQIYIVKQSSISAAVSALSVGSKTAPESAAVIKYAQELVDFVFAKPAPEPDKTGFDDFQDDMPD